ncbi:MAG: AHH domain-containing protein [Polyangiaceae bacterium]
MIVGGLYSMVSGTGGEILGGAETATGVGAPVGAATIAVSTTMVVGGAANVLVGVQSLLAAPKGGGAVGASNAPSSRALGRALGAAGHARPPGSAAHHIVAGNAPAAAPARAVLEKFGIGINDAANGAFRSGTRSDP